MPKSRSLAEYQGPRRWTDADAHAVLDAARDSGVSLAAFAAREGFDPQRLYFWRRRLGRGANGSSAPTFVEVRASASAAQHIEVVLRSGQILRVAASIDGSDLRRLADALERDEAC